MGINHGYDVKLTGVDLVDRNLQAVKQALDIVAAAIASPVIVTFVSLGANGVGRVALVPPKMPDGTAPLYRALAGFRLVAAIDLNTLVSLQVSFEQILSSNDSIRQLTSLNLSARNIVFVLQG